ncbi:unnamed protein product [Boreogadus saida]
MMVEEVVVMVLEEVMMEVVLKEEVEAVEVVVLVLMKEVDVEVEVVMEVEVPIVSDNKLPWVHVVCGVCTGGAPQLSITILPGVSVTEEDGGGRVGGGVPRL